MQPLHEKLIKENKNIFLLGDFNFNFLDLENQENMDFFQLMMSHHFLPCITIPTKINHKVNTVIDNIFTNNIYQDSTSGNLTLSLSDHLPSFLVVPRENQVHKPTNNNIYKRDTKNLNKNVLAHDLTSKIGQLFSKLKSWILIIL